ncbi:hypothetical protein HZS_6517 [Henneguya salminicola]|nr:hypothetical protein HZS_6517 [Henneguya salminicola]
MAEIGSKIYVNAYLRSINNLLINVGFGLHLEMTPDEAKSYAEDKIKTDAKSGFEIGFSILNRIS